MTNAMMNTQLYQKMYAEQEQYRAWLLKSPCPLADVYEHFRNQEHGHMEQIRSAIETCAKKSCVRSFQLPGRQKGRQ